jgi:hypothetical protein
VRDSVAGRGGSMTASIRGVLFLFDAGSFPGSRFERVKMWVYRLHSLISSRARR